MSNDWLRVWHELPNDPKWRTIARNSGQSISEVMAVYMHLLVAASMNNDERGSIDNIESEDIASALDMPHDVTKAILQAMDGRVIIGQKLKGWEKRQPKKEDDSAAERKKKQREKEKAEKEKLGFEPKNNKNTPVTTSGNSFGHATSRNVTTDTDTDTDTDIDSSLRSLSSVTAFAETGNHENHDLLENKPENDSKASKSANKLTNNTPVAEPQPLENQPKTTERGGMASDDKTSKPATYPPDFERFWNDYPSERRREKPNALKAWKLAIKQAPPDEIMAGLEAYAASRQVADGFSCYPAKWLKNQRWAEEYKPTTQGNQHVQRNQQQQPASGGYQSFANKAERYDAATNRVLADIEAGRL